MQAVKQKQNSTKIQQNSAVLITDGAG